MSSVGIFTRSGRQTDLFKFSDKYGKELQCPYTYGSPVSQSLISENQGHEVWLQFSLFINIIFEPTRTANTLASHHRCQTSR